MSRVLPMFLAVSLFGAGAARAQSSEQEAGDVSEIDRDSTGPLKDRIPPVSGHFFLHKGRFELTPSLGLSVKDAFFTKYILGGSLTYHATESVGVVLRGGYSLATVSGAAQKCVFPKDQPNLTTPQCGPPTYAELDGRVPGQILAVAGLALEWAPLYGKIALVSEKFLHFDLYGVLGPTAVLYGGPLTAGSTQTTGHVSTWTVGGDVGLGARFFVNHWFTVRTELRDIIYRENTSSTTTSTRNQFVFDLGFSFFFPTSFEEG